jgi:hypothetical protein
MKHKTADLEGDTLDYLVQCSIRGERPLVSVAEWAAENDTGFHPSRNWAHGGPIIEGVRISISCGGLTPAWRAKTIDKDRQYIVYADAATPLIAAMRAFVQSRFGDEVEL